ncbi:MAG TPA: amidohydrolase family protein [Burkholderiales bacterium]|jgi:predicted TIM-barrel fold metal-dependent hydrolase
MSAPSPGRLRAPAGACDCHIHIIPPQAQHPFSPDRSYTPRTAVLADLNAMHGQVGIERLVIVTPSTYGTDNAVTLEVIRENGLERTRGVAVIDMDISDAGLQRLHAGGVRGIRINMEVRREADPAEGMRRLQAAATRIAGSGWHIQANVRLSVIQALADELAALPVQLVFDHYGHARGAEGIAQPGFAEMLALLRDGRAYVKLSAPYQAGSAPQYPELVALAQACIAANRERVLWGSNWPHPDLRPIPGYTVHEPRPYREVDDAAAFDFVARYAPDTATRQALFTDNPARLYGF